jgi:hypothetical protein
MRWSGGLAKSKDKKRRRGGPVELLVVESEAFPHSVIVELWHEGKKGKREYLDSRRYEAVDEVEAAVAASEVGIEEACLATA